MSWIFYANPFISQLQNIFLKTFLPFWKKIEFGRKQQQRRIIGNFLCFLHGVLFDGFVHKSPSWLGIFWALFTRSSIFNKSFSRDLKILLFVFHKNSSRKCSRFSFHRAELEQSIKLHHISLIVLCNLCFTRLVNNPEIVAQKLSFQQIFAKVLNEEREFSLVFSIGFHFHTSLDGDRNENLMRKSLIQQINWNSI